MIDVQKIKAENAARKARKDAAARNDQVAETIDALIAEVEQLRAMLTDPCQHCGEGPREVICAWCGIGQC